MASDNIPGLDEKLWRRSCCVPCTEHIAFLYRDLGWPAFDSRTGAGAKAILIRAMIWTAYVQCKEVLTELVFPRWVEPNLLGESASLTPLFDILGKFEARFQEWNTPVHWLRLGPFSFSSWIVKALCATNPPVFYGQIEQFRKDFVRARQTHPLNRPHTQPSPFYGLNLLEWALFLTATQPRPKEPR